MKKQPELTEITRSNLLEAFWRMSETTPISMIKVTTLVKIAGYNRSTFYAYFEDIFALLHYAEQQLIDELIENLHNAIANIEAMDSLEKFAELYEKRAHHLSILLGPNGDPAFISTYKKALMPVVLRMANITTITPQIELICEYGLSAVIYTLAHWYDLQKPITAQELAALMGELAASGIFKVIRGQNGNDGPGIPS